ILTVGRNEFSQEQEEVLNLNQVEKLTIAKALQIYGTTTKGKQAAAQALGIGTATLYRKMDLYRLSHR
ncbi:MAG: helix-turn-helix domain-containing protein, partial [Bacillota bacterium]